MKPSTNKTQWVWLNTTWGCGALWVDEEQIIRGGAPIFRRLYGRHLPKAIETIEADGKLIAWQYL